MATKKVTKMLLPWPIAVAAALRRWEPFVPEFLLILLSGFLAYATIYDRITVSTNSGMFDAINALGIGVDTFGTIALIAMALKAAGLFVCLTDRGSIGGTYLRVAGLAMSAFIWLTLGIVIFSRNQYSVAWLPMCAWGLTAIWTLLRYPAMPRQDPE